ncbi:hypothetical protein M3M38_07460 [Fructilactobacillus cliffordii]|uniref:hypothetical protein n=1 Tax=Fructilactobacillus cliffordii TaxID=2940299 RepID=UPI002092F9BF|nr:hypothetical protein [Fructilactobacillus cliffordii]USS86497.1 hypothetical protein M3M38_07460 [Fructilactobacillus cliffordii]
MKKQLFVQHGTSITELGNEDYDELMATLAVADRDDQDSYEDDHVSHGINEETGGDLDAGLDMLRL